AQNEVVFLPGQPGMDVVYEIDGEDSELDYALPKASLRGDVWNDPAPLVAALLPSGRDLQAAGLDQARVQSGLIRVEASWYDPTREELVPDVVPKLEIVPYDEGPDELQVGVEGGSDWLFVRL